ncbi:hypothetical protein [Nitratifractor sp.]
MIDRDELLKRFPKIMSRMDEDTDALRYLLVVDANLYDPEIDDEFDVFDPNDYNFMIYLPETLQEAVGLEVLKELPDLIEERGIFESFLNAEGDLFGAKSDLDEEGVALKVLEIIEERLPQESA